MRREYAAVADGQIEWFYLVSCFSDRIRKRRDALDRNIAEKLQRQMQVVFAGPTCAHAWKYGAKLIDVFFDRLTDVRGEFDGNEGAVCIHRLHRLHR